MPAGESDEDNLTIYKWGEIGKFDFEPLEHSELGRKLGLIDVAKAAEVSGSRFYYMKGDLVLMQFALTQFAFDVVGNEEIIAQIVAERKLDISTKPFVPMLPPVMIRDCVQRSIHRVFGDQTYTIENEELNLVASAEHTMAPYHMGETLDNSDLPKRYIGYSTAFRREAGTYGKDMGGIFRVHQFDKAEMLSFTDAQTGEAEQQLIVGLQEYILRKLEIPYQLQQVCTGDTGAPDYQQFDIEAWLPGQDKYRETHTSDYMTDYQMRGVKSFYKDADGKKKLLHTNDATAVTGRVLVAIMENYQQADGNIAIPKALQSYMGGRKILRKTA
jgi:seryl-tRNA synthetase